MQPWDVEMQGRTTVTANHAESARPKSIADKIAKQGTCLQEPQETRAWLVLLQQRGYVDEATAHQLIGESDELIGLFVASIRRLGSQ